MPSKSSIKSKATYKRAIFSLGITTALLLALGLIGLSTATAQSSPPQQSQPQPAKQFPLHSSVLTNANANRREQPSSTGKVLTVIPKNTKLEVMGGPFYVE